MAEYIERAEAINEFAIRSFFYNAEWGNKRFTSDDVNEILRSIPAADVRPVVRATWRRYSPFTDTYECSNCGEQVIDESFRTNFCPNCGCAMEET